MTTLFSAVLTGSQDGLEDLPLVVSSISMTLRESTACYVSLIVSYAQLESINDRPNGYLDIYKSVDGSTPSLVVRTNQSDIRVDYGAAARSLRLTGTTTSSFTPFDTVALYKADVITDRLLSDGRKAWQINPELDIWPGDTVNYYEGTLPDAYVIDIVTVEVNGKQNQVTITEE